MSDDTPSVWPPPPENDVPLGEDPQQVNAQVEAILRQTRISFWLGLLACGILQIVTVILGTKANKRAGKGVAAGYIIVASIQLAVLLFVFVNAIIRFMYGSR